ncbi:MAG: hydrogenase maturation protease [Anaerolineae bacterium]|nr:hydrogenase maturation protease [Anaerolineae bacterium]
MQNQPQVLILGLGNLLLQDEGLGIKALQWLQKTYAWPANVTLMDGGVMGLELMPYIEAADMVCIIDAVFPC